ncbi:sigma-54 interaction domain-containing protein [Alicyclobacillus herbarius]|uniref:sigma-54 interaction domain-containing protein n=1 Tax=Alicyclobacillus herbarius TaxID=122960 RepID=UPI00041B9CAD|nr:sigma 54-interacting transcriptional regulator [Alicyclobacillus herbarius]
MLVIDASLKSRLPEVIEWFPDGVYVVDGKGYTLLVNSAYEALSGARRDELIGRHMAELIESGFINCSVSLVVLETKRTESLMQNLRNGREVIVTGTPVFNEDGGIELVVTSVRDITELNRVSAELERVRGLSELHRHRYRVGDDQEPNVIAKSPAMRRIVEQVRQVAPYPTSVLLTGPSGCGKEVMANLIHQLSDRRNQPFIKVNCAAIPENLLESELMGYEDGAFTGARRGGKPGLLELADKGTILLDEIGDMPLSLQAKLLRVLQDMRVQRVGGTKARPIDVRIISATNQDLRQLVRDGRFREDLFYRLQVVEIRIPPLAERPEDVEAFIDFFFSYYKSAYRMDKRLAAKTRVLLTQYPWPGNVREVKNFMESLVVSVPSLLVEPHHLPPHIQQVNPTIANETKPLRQRLESIEKEWVREALRQHGTYRQAARALGIDHSTLVKKVKRWGLHL